VIERFFRTLKYEGLCGLQLPLRREAMRRLMLSLVGWYNEFRPHATLERLHAQRAVLWAVPRQSQAAH